MLVDLYNGRITVVVVVVVVVLLSFRKFVSLVSTG